MEVPLYFDFDYEIHISFKYRLLGNITEDLAKTKIIGRIIALIFAGTQIPKFQFPRGFCSLALIGH